MKEVPVQRAVQRLATIAVASTIVALGLGGTPRIALAASYEELQQQFEESVAAHDAAVAHVDEIQEQIDENQERIEQIEQEIPAQRRRAAESLRTLYRIQQSSGGLVELILSSEDFNELITMVTYLDRIQSRNMGELQELAEMDAELQQAKDTLSAQKAQADQEAEAALEAQERALAAREEVRLQAIAQAEAEREAAEAALKQAARDAEEGKSFTTASGRKATVSSTTQKSTPAEAVSPQTEQRSEQKSDTESAQPAQKTSQGKGIVSERDAFISTWAPRIDAYLSGSPLGGHGRTFAEAAWDYNVDPRWSPAISCIESSKGAVCFRPHNAWGWGSSSWSDWDTAIRSHVAGLSEGYGYTISTSAARKYCPPTWQSWYSSVLAEMSSI